MHALGVEIFGFQLGQNAEEAPTLYEPEDIQPTPIDENVLAKMESDDWMEIDEGISLEEAQEIDNQKGEPSEEQ